MKKDFTTRLVWLFVLSGYFLYLPVTIKANDTVHYYINDIVFIYGPICEGDTFVNDQIFFPCPCPDFHEFYNIHQYPNAACNAITCEMVGLSFPVVQGPNIIQNELTGYSTGNSCDGLTLPTWHLKAKPDVTSEYIVAWDKYKFDEYAPCGAGNTVRAYHYRDTFTVTVHNVPVPDFTIDTPEAPCGASISMTFQNCAWGQSPSYYKEIMNSCGQGQTNTCQNPVYTVAAPDYLTEIGFAARYQRSDYPYCRSNWSPYQNVSVVESPDPNACNDPAIQYIESLLSDPANMGRSDYHNYPVVNNLCYPPGNSQPCTPQSAWNFLKSSYSYQAPSSSSFPDNAKVNKIIGRQIALPGSSLPAGPIQNCQDVNLPSTWLRLIAGVTSLHFLLLCPAYPITLANDPIKIVVDENCKCITNYTMPGHILYPGKIRRCLFVNACNEIQVRTTGTGFHFCGDNIFGLIMSKINKSIGMSTFNNVDQNFIINFNQ